MKHRIELFLCVLIGLLLYGLNGCTQSVPVETSGERIVSLSPGITATIVDIGQGKNVVGRSAFCTTVDARIPVVGDLYSVDYERLLRLRPTKVFVQKTAGEIDSHLLKLAEEGDFSLHAWKCDRVGEIAAMHDELLQLLSVKGAPMRITLQETGIPLPETILIMTPGSDGKAGLCFGRQTYLDDLLDMMGGINAIKSSGWISLSIEDIARLSPSVIVVISDTQFALSKGILSLDIPIISFIHPDVLIPSSRITEVAIALQHKIRAQ